MAEVAAGHVLADRYEVGEPLGTGGSGAVWTAHDRVLERTVAVKVVPDGSAAARLAREARATAGIGVENVVAVYDVGQQGDQHFLVMEFVDGVDLATLLSATGPLPPDLVALIGRDIARGVAAVHAADLVHRDVTPSNVLISAQGAVKLTDLGIARRTDDEATRALTQAGTVVGTVDYLAPEQVEGGEVTAASDVYAVGLVLHTLLTGLAPFGDGTVGERIARRLAGGPARLDEAVGGLADVVERASARQPADRPADGDALRRLLGGLVPDDAAPLRERLADLVAEARSAGPSARPARTDAIEAVAFPAAGAKAPPADAPQVPGEEEAAARAPAASAPPAHEPNEPAPAGHDMTATTSIPVHDAQATGAAATPAPESVTSQEPAEPTPATRPVEDTTAAPADTSQVHGGRRLAGPLAMAVLGVVVTIGLVSLILAGVGGDGNGDGQGGDGQDVAPLAIAGVDDHDPLGGGGEHGDEIGRVADGDPQTAWDTEGYNSPDLGGLKSGVGFLIDLGSVQEIAAVELDLGLEGIDFAVVVSDERPDGDPTQSGTVLGQAQDAGGTARVEGGPVSGQWVSIWFTALGDDGGRFRAAVAEVRVLGS